jgi:hypothetical protein
MADQRNSTFDPLASWRNWLSDAETRWNSFFNKMMETDQFSRAMSRFTELSLNMQLSWSPHVAELRVLVSPAMRGKGLGRLPHRRHSP